MNYIVKNIELDKANINGRIYPTEEVQKMFDDPIVQEQLTNKMMFVQYGSDPENGVDMARVCGIVRDIKVIPGEHIFVDVDIIPTDAMKNIAANTNLYMSCRGSLDVLSEPVQTARNLEFIKFYFNV